MPTTWHNPHFTHTSFLKSETPHPQLLVFDKLLSCGRIILLKNKRGLILLSGAEKEHLSTWFSYATVNPLTLKLGNCKRMSCFIHLNEVLTPRIISSYAVWKIWLFRSKLWCALWSSVVFPHAWNEVGVGNKTNIFRKSNYFMLGNLLVF